LLLHGLVGTDGSQMERGVDQHG